MGRNSNIPLNAVAKGGIEDEARALEEEEASPPNLPGVPMVVAAGEIFRRG